jgi:hypothetical protein
MAESIVQSIVRSYNGKTIRIRDDKYICLTDMATATGKQTNDWLRLKSSVAYLKALSGGTGIPVPVLLEVADGNPTWAHQKIAIRFAQWCSPEFAVQVDFWIDELMTTGTVSIEPQPAASVEKPKLKIAPRKLKASTEMRLLKQMLDLVPGLDETRKAATMFGHIAKHHPEMAEMAQTAIAVLPCAPATEKTFTPTEIGRMLNPQLSSRAVNIKLIDAGLQESYRSAKDVLKYKATEIGAGHSVLTVESKADGTPTESLRWKESVVEQLSIRAVQL